MLKISILVFAFAAILLLLRFCYYGGSLSRNCIYIEHEISLPEKIRNSKVYFIKNAYLVDSNSNLSGGVQTDFSCLTQMGKVKYEIVEQRYAYLFKNNKQQVDPSKNIELRPIKLLVIEKPGFSSLDSSGPIQYLILEDSNGIHYKVSTLGLGINDGDEFLKAISNNEEILLKGTIDFTK